MFPRIKTWEPSLSKPTQKRLHRPQIHNVSTASRTFFDWGLLRRVLVFASPYKTKFWTSIVLAIFLAVVTPIRPLLIQQTVNTYILKEIPKMVVLVTMIQIGIIVIETVLRFGFTFLTASLGQSVVDRKSTRLNSSHVSESRMPSSA